MRKKIFCAVVIASLFLAGCGGTAGRTDDAAIENAYKDASDQEAQGIHGGEGCDAGNDGMSASEQVVLDAEAQAAEDVTENSGDAEGSADADGSGTDAAYSLADYDGEPYEIINGNRPFFEEYEYTTDPFEEYSPLDSLGRCGVAYANICRELMPTEERESISEVKPSGWNNKPYDFIDGGYIYNRCHLIAFELAGENANERNLITGTRYFNVTGMLPFENMVADYVRETDNHVLYRVTPVYEGDNLVADGVLMEAYSVEDDGESIEFCVFVFNVQPGVTIDYATGDNWADGEDQSDEEGTYEKRRKT